MDLFNDYQTKKAEFFANKQFRSSTFPTYEVWMKIIMQGYLGDDTPQDQVLLDNTKQVSKGSKNKFKNFKKNQQKKLSTKERLRKKLLEKNEKEMLKRL